MKEVKEFNMKMELNLWERLRKAAYERRTNMSDLVRKGLLIILSEKEKEEK